MSEFEGGYQMSKILKEYGIEEDPRYKQCFKEAMSALILYAVHMVWVLGSVYLLWYVGDSDGRVFGLPSYLFWGVLVGSIALIIAIWLMIKFIYKDMPLDAESSGETEDSQ